MRVFVGTSGYSYKEWKGPFFPKALPASDFLRFYAMHFATVEINNTFYRMPNAKLIEGWASEARLARPAESGPDAFVFSIKAPSRITHVAKLRDSAATVDVFLRAATSLGGMLGPLLFQLPPFMKKDVPVLAAFLAQIPKGLRISFEFRHPSWFDGEVWETLRKHGSALCVAEGETLECPLVATADWGYLRLRRDAYPDDVISTWAARILAQPWHDAFVYLKHDQGDAPSVAKRLMDALGTAAVGGQGTLG